ncbi:SDR family oxidoreductase [Micromonospora sp. B11E3]|uniref:SDR family NAD(P)-dependent oxidoreductase n=1 Tax=Micromonospora sp. B11E3 TaxID=3153562 RepID=UPI00325F5A87
MTRLTGRTAMVTGAGNGIGRAIATTLGRAGANVVVVDVLGDDAERTAREITADGGAAIFDQVNIAEPKQVEGLVERAVGSFGGMDIIVNNAGVGGTKARLHEVEPEDFARVLTVNIGGTFNCTKYALPHLMSSKHGGAVVNIASTYGLIGAPLAAAYCSSKAAIINLTRQLAVDYGPEGVRVNAICPGYIDTGLGRRGPTLTTEQFTVATEIRERAAARQPLGRQGTVQEVADVALFLVSDSSTFMTGSILAVDGGCLTTFNYGDASN